MGGGDGNVEAQTLTSHKNSCTDVICVFTKKGNSAALLENRGTRLILYKSPRGLAPLRTDAQGLSLEIRGLSRGVKPKNTTA